MKKTRFIGIWFVQSKLLHTKLFDTQAKAIQALSNIQVSNKAVHQIEMIYAGNI